MAPANSGCSRRDMDKVLIQMQRPARGLSAVLDSMVGVYFDDVSY